MSHSSEMRQDPSGFDGVIIQPYAESRSLAVAAVRRYEKDAPRLATCSDSRSGQLLESTLIHVSFNTLDLLTQGTSQRYLLRLCLRWNTPSSQNCLHFTPLGMISKADVRHEVEQAAPMTDQHDET